MAMAAHRQEGKGCMGRVEATTNILLYKATIKKAANEEVIDGICLAVLNFSFSYV